MSPPAGEAHRGRFDCPVAVKSMTRARRDVSSDARRQRRLTERKLRPLLLASPEQNDAARRVIPGVPPSTWALEAS
jgi:hypothetical protein